MDKRILTQNEEIVIGVDVGEKAASRGGARNETDAVSAIGHKAVVIAPNKHVGVKTNQREA